MLAWPAEMMMTVARDVLDDGEGWGDGKGRGDSVKEVAGQSHP